MFEDEDIESLPLEENPAYSDGAWVTPEDIQTARLGQEFERAIASGGVLDVLYKTASECAAELAMQLIEDDLSTQEARDKQVQAQGWMKMKSIIDEFIQQGREAAEGIAQADLEAKTNTQRTPVA